MSKTLFGTTTVTVGDDEYELTPTLDAVRKIERVFGGLRPALESLGTLSVDQTAVIIAAGAGLNNKDSKALPDDVFAAGVGEVAPQLVPYIVSLLNPGNKQEEGDEGNGKKTKKAQ